jgi:hypothetical protein
MNAAKLRLGYGADPGSHHLAMLEEHQRRDAADVVVVMGTQSYCSPMHVKWRYDE